MISLLLGIEQIAKGMINSYDDSVSGCPADECDSYSKESLFRAIYGSVHVEHVNYKCNEGCWGRSRGILNGVNEIRFYSPSQGKLDPRLVVHEFGHAFNASVYAAMDRVASPYKDLNRELNVDASFPTRDDAYNGYAGIAYGWQQSKELTPGEEFADMFVGWAYDTWATDKVGAGTAREAFMSSNMPFWISMALP